MHVRVDIDADGPVVVKSAAPGAEGRLRREGERLARATHPGVVALVAPADGSGGPLARTGELRTRYAGEPVSGWRGTLHAVAGLGSAVASTLADLHDLGIVHGRVDGGHVLIGADGRPRLCGLAPDGPGDGGADGGGADGGGADGGGADGGGADGGGAAGGGAAGGGAAGGGAGG
ncbi:MAG TPA: hypothetical protein VFI47_07830, partial [Acidimicrobiales bacterium]|nr:hypothetical protein [Acidimicrobiales bacterium]